MSLELTPLDVASLEIAKKYVSSGHGYGDSVNVVRSWSDRHAATWRFMGLSEEEIDVLHLWAGLFPVAGVDEMSRQAKRCLDGWPLLDEHGDMPRLHLWRQVLMAYSGQGCFPHLLYELTRLAGLKGRGRPMPRFALVVLKLGDWLWARLGEDTLMPTDLHDLLAGADQRDSAKRRPEDRVTLYKVWQSGLGLAPFMPGFDLSAEDLLAALADRDVEINVWSRRPEGMDRSLVTHECNACGLFSLDGFGWCWRSGGRNGLHVSCQLCPGCQRRTAKDLFIGCPACCGHLKDGVCDLAVGSVSGSTEAAGSGHTRMSAKAPPAPAGSQAEVSRWTKEVEPPTQGKLL